MIHCKFSTGCMSADTVILTFIDESSNHSIPRITLVEVRKPHEYMVLRIIQPEDYGHPFQLTMSEYRELVLIFNELPAVGQIIPSVSHIHDQHRFILKGIRSASIIIYGGGGRTLKSRLKQIEYADSP